MGTAAPGRPKTRKKIKVLQDYDIAADAKNRISLRGVKTKYFHVTVLSNGSYVLEPRLLVAPDAVSVRTLKTLKRSAENLRKGKASPAVTLAARKPGKAPSCYDLAKGLIGSIKGLPKDIATNPKYMEGFGE